MVGHWCHTYHQHAHVKGLHMNVIAALSCEILACNVLLALNSSWPNL